MQEVRRGVGIGNCIGQLLKFEGPFEGSGIIEAPTNDHTLFHVAVALCLDCQVVVQFQDSFHPFRGLFQVVPSFGAVSFQCGRDHRHCHQLGGVGLAGGNCLFFTCHDVNYQVGCFCQRRIGCIRNCHGWHTLPSAFLEYRDDIGGFAGLGNAHNQGICQAGGSAVIGEQGWQSQCNCQGIVRPPEIAGIPPGIV